MTLIALVEARDDIRARIAQILRAEGYQVSEAADGATALRMVYEDQPDVALVDLGTDGVSGFDLIRILRAACSLPIVGLTTVDSSTEVVKALDAGADDLVATSCGAVELLARVRAAIRRHQRTDPRPASRRQIHTGALVIDRDMRTVRKHGIPVQLSNTEYRLLEALATRVGETAPHRFLLTNVWGEQYLNDVQYLRVYIGYLRNKLEDDPRNPQYLASEWGVGYRLARLPIEAEHAGAVQPAMPLSLASSF